MLTLFQFVPCIRFPPLTLVGLSVLRYLCGPRHHEDCDVVLVFVSHDVVGHVGELHVLQRFDAHFFVDFPSRAFFPALVQLQMTAGQGQLARAVGIAPDPGVDAARRWVHHQDPHSNSDMLPGTACRGGMEGCRWIHGEKDDTAVAGTSVKGRLLRSGKKGRERRTWWWVVVSVATEAWSNTNSEEIRRRKNYPRKPIVPNGLGAAECIPSDFSTAVTGGPESTTSRNPTL